MVTAGRDQSLSIRSKRKPPDTVVVALEFGDVAPVGNTPNPNDVVTAAGRRQHLSVPGKHQPDREVHILEQQWPDQRTRRPGHVDKEQVGAQPCQHRLDDDLPRAEPVLVLTAIQHHLQSADTQAEYREADPVEARAVVARFVEHYNGVRLHSAIGYIAPNDMLAGRAKAIWAERDRKLEAAREARRVRRAERAGPQEVAA